MGASQLVVDGRIKVKSLAEIERISEHAVHLTDGSELLADLVVLATGYGSINQWAAELISPEVAARVASDLFEHLDAPVRRVGALDAPVAYCPDLEEVILPGSADVLAAILETARY